MNTFDCITVDTAEKGGYPSIRGLHIPVATILGLLADRLTQMRNIGIICVETSQRPEPLPTH